MLSVHPRVRAAWHRPALVGAQVAAATAVLAVGNPNTTHLPLCPLKAVTGLDCPFCGSLRAVHALAHLHPGEAASHNLLFTLAAPVLVVSWALWLARSVRPLGRPPWRPVLPRPAVVAFCFTAAAFMVARNLPRFAWLGSDA